VRNYFKGVGHRWRVIKALLKNGRTWPCSQAAFDSDNLVEHEPHRWLDEDKMEHRDCPGVLKKHATA
jgi:hypothetical protein